MYDRLPTVMNDMIVKRLKIINDLQHELKKLQEHMKETLENDSDYQEAQ